MDDAQVRLCGKAGLLHALGKMAIDANVLNKPGPLTDQEFMDIQTHPQCGYEMLLSIKDMPLVVLDVCLHHHEKYNGSGYPGGLRAEEISIYARIYMLDLQVRPRRPTSSDVSASPEPPCPRS